jgi:hypothetical protein
MSAVSSLEGVLLRQVPEELASAVTSGECRVYGSIIRSLTSGRIVGHLQETSALANMAGSFLTAPVSLPLQGASLAVDAVGHSISYVQNEQIKAALAAVQSMQVADLALGAGAIGVSVAGFAILSRKLSRIETNVEALDAQLGELSKSVELIRRDQIGEDMVRLRTAIEQLDEGWVLTHPTAQWRRVANEAHFLANRFHGRVRELLELPSTHLTTADPFLEAFALASNVRISARMAANDDAAARRAAEESATAQTNLSDKIRLGEAALAAVLGKAVPGTIEWNSSLELAADELRPIVEQVRRRTTAAAATCLTLEELNARQIGGHAWLKAARDEQDSPLLFMSAAA